MSTAVKSAAQQLLPPFLIPTLFHLIISSHLGNEKKLG